MGKKTSKLKFTVMFCLSTFFGIFIALAVLEVFGRFETDPTTTRSSDAYTLDPDLGYFNAPHAKKHWKDEFGNTADFTINSAGFRGGEIDSVKKRKRVVLVGDSMVFGHLITDEETTAVQLGELLNHDRRPMEVVNGGVTGYGIDQEYKLLGRLLKLKPDYLVWCLYYNDFILYNNMELMLYDYDQGTDRLSERDVRHSLFYLTSKLYLASKKWWYRPRSLELLYRIVNNYSTWREAKTSRLPILMGLKFRKFTTSLSEIAERQGIHVAVVVLPDQYHLFDLSFLSQYSAIPITDFNRDPTFIKNWDRLFLRHDSHLSRFGNGLVAKAIRDWIFTITPRSR